MDERRYGLIGEKLSHSFSKLIHQKLKDYDYQLIEIKKEDIDSFMTKKEFAAINVTIPYKQTVIPYLDFIDDAAKEISAVNTVVNKDGKLYGYNTDYLGLKYMLLKNNVCIEGKKAMILGSGGTCKTAKRVLSDMGAKEITVVSRFGGEGKITYEQAVKLTDTDIILNASPKGMYPNNYDESFDIDNFDNLSAVVDVIYNPLNTSLVLKAKERGINAFGGLLMLVGQAKYACEFFTGEKIDDSEIDKIYSELLTKQSNLVLIGMPGCGKSTLGKILEEKLQKKLIDIDAEIEKRENMKISEIFEKFGEERFREIEIEVTADIAKQNNVIISTGGGVIKNACNIKALKQNGIICFVDRELEALQLGQGRPLSSDFDKVKVMYTQRHPLYKKYCDFSVDNNSKIEETADKIKEKYYEAFGYQRS